MIVVLLRELLAGDGKDVLDERLVLLNGLVNSVGSADVAHNTTHVDGELARRDAAAGDGIDELLLGTLRIFDFERLNDDALELGGHLLHDGNWFGLVVLDADVGVRDAKSLAEDADTYANLFGMLHHDTVVAGEVRLALDGIDDKVFSLFVGSYGILDMSGECGAAKTNDTHSLEFVDYFFWLQGALAFDVGSTVDGFFPFVAFNVDVDGTLSKTESVLAGVDFSHGAAERGVDVGAHKSFGFAYQLANFDFVALSHTRSGGCTEVLVHKDDGGLWEREFLDDCRCGYLVFFGVDTTHCECFHFEVIGDY